MKFIGISLAIALGCCLSGFVSAQESPVEISKKELPKKAKCVVCAAREGGETEERPAAGLRYKGVSYYFCNAKEIEEFKKEPDSWIPLPLPRPAPIFKLATLSDSEASLEKYHGKALLLDFWATWCKPCVEGMPELQKLHDKFSSKGLAVLGVSIDEKGEKVVKPFIAKRKFSYQIALDTTNKPTWQAYRVKGIPSLFLIDAQGSIVRHWIGKPDKKEVEKAVVELLARSKVGDEPNSNQ